MKYKIKNTDIQLNGKIIPEGSEIVLNKEQIKGIEDFLIPISSPESISGNSVVSEPFSESEFNYKNAINKKTKGNKK